jgi:hypothetical protein
MAAQEYQAPESVSRLQQRAYLVGGVALLVSIFGAVRAPELFFPSYLMSFLLILGLTVGSLGLLMLQHLTSGHWGIIIRRPLESATRALPLMIIAFLPIAIFGMKYLYTGHGEEKGWLNASATGEGALSDFQKSYLTAHGFYTRAVIYFAIWLALMFIFNILSKQQDTNREDRALRLRLKMLAGPGLILYVFAMTFASIDWVMSLSPHWASTIYGFLFVAGQLISSMALMIAVVVLRQRFAEAPLARLGEIAPRFCDALGVFRFLAAPDHLVGEPAGRNHFLSHAALWRLGRRCGDRAGLPFLRAFFPAPLAGCEAQRESASQDRHLADLHASRGSILDDASGIHFSRYAHLAGHCFAPRARRFVARFLCIQLEAVPTAAARRPGTCGGH